MSSCFNKIVIAFVVVAFGMAFPTTAIAEHGAPPPSMDDGADSYLPAVPSEPSASGESDSPSVGTDALIYDHLLRQWEADDNSRIAADKTKTESNIRQVIVTRQVVTQMTATGSGSQTSSGAYALNAGQLPARGNAGVMAPVINVSAPNVTVVNSIPTNGGEKNSIQGADRSSSKVEVEPENVTNDNRPKEITAMNLLWPDSSRENETKKPNTVVTGATLARIVIDPNRDRSPWENLARRMWSYLWQTKSRQPTRLIAAESSEVLPSQEGIQVPIENVPEDQPGRLVARASTASSDSLWIPFAATGWGVAAGLLLWVRRLRQKV